MSRPFYIDYANIKFPKLYDKFRFDFDEDVTNFALIGHIGSGKSLVACDKLCVQYPIHCGVPDEKNEIRVTTAIMRNSKDALMRTIHQESICSLYQNQNMIIDGLQSRSPSGITIHFSFDKNGKKIKVWNTIHYISLFDKRAEASITGYQPHGILVSEPESLPAFTFEYLTARSRNIKGVTRPIMLYEGEVPQGSHQFFNIFPLWDEQDRNRYPKGWIQDKQYNIEVDADVSKGQIEGYRYTKPVKNRIYVSSDAATRYAFNTENLPDDYFIKEQAKSIFHIKKRVNVIPTIMVDGEPGWTNFIQTKHYAPVEYIPQQPIYLFFDADARGVIGIVQTLNNQIRFLEIILCNGSITQKLETTAAYLRDRCPEFRIAGAYLDPAINNTNEFLGKDNSMLAQFKRESKRLFNADIKFDVAKDRLGNPAISLEARRDATIKAFRDLDDGRPGLLINDKMIAENQRKVDDDIAKYRFVMKNDGTISNKPLKTDTADIINYACITLSTWEDKKYETEEDKKRKDNYMRQENRYNETPTAIKSIMRNKIFGKRRQW